MQNKHLKFAWLMALIISVCVVLTFMSVVYADTDGSELQVTDQPEKLVLQLGPGWAGVEFELHTDVGLYPQPVIVSPEGILTMELGGSTTYTLSALRSSVPIPILDTGAPEESSENFEPGLVEGPFDDDLINQQSEVTDEMPTQSDAPVDAEAPPQNTEDENSLINGIPNMHLFLFAGGLIVGIISLIIIWIIKRRKNNPYYNAEEYYEDQY